MAQLKFTLRSAAKSDGTHAIRLRITENRVAGYLSTNYSIKKEYWNDDKGETTKAYDNSVAFNNVLLNLRVETENKIFDLQRTNKDINCQQIIAQLTEKVSFDLLSMGLEYVNTFKGSESNYNTFMSRYNVLLRYVGTKHYQIKDVSVQWLKDYYTWMMKPIHVHGKQPFAEKTAMTNLAFVRTIMKQAVDTGIIKYHENPFRTYTLHKVDGDKVPLNYEEMTLMRQLQIDSTDANLYDTKNIFLFMFNCMGMRIGDALQLRWSNIFKEGIMQYKMEKSDDLMTITLTPEAVKILNLYKDRVTDFSGYIFPFLDRMYPSDPNATVYRRIRMATKYINSSLKRIAKKTGITKNISTHVARHSWVDAALQIGTPMYSIGAALGHENEQTTRNYTKRGFHLPKLNEINQRVVAIK